MNGDDEYYLICEENSIFTYICCILIALFILLYASPKIFRKIKQRNDVEDEIPSTKPLKTDADHLLNLYQEVHDSDDEDKKNYLNIALLKMYFSETEEIKKNIGKKIFEKEERLHGSVADAIACLHSNLDPKINGLILDSKYPGLSSKIPLLAMIKDFLTKRQRIENFLTFVRKLKGMNKIYLDHFKDIQLCVILMIVAGGLTIIVNYPTEFASVIAVIFLFTIISPLFLSTLNLCINNPEIIFPDFYEKSIWKKMLMIGCVFLFSIFLPVKIFETYEDKMQKLKNNILKDKETSRDEIEKVREVKKQWLNFLRLELTLENFYQIPLQIILLFLTQTETGTVRLPALDAIFDKSSFFGLVFDARILLILSVLWSIKSCIFLQLKTTALGKGFFPTKATIIVLFWSLFGTCRRILSLVLFFAPSLGLFNLLHHFQEESAFPFKIRKQFPNEVHVALFNASEDILWTDLDRWNYDQDPKNPTPPAYTIYTGLTLKHTFFIFILLIVFHFTGTLLIKILTSRSFRSKEMMFSKFLHVLECLNICRPHQDWDEEKDSVEGHKKRFREVSREMFWSIMFSNVVSILHMVPTWFTGDSNIFSFNIQIQFYFS